MAAFEPAARLLRLAQALEAGETPDPVVADWFARGVDGWISEGQALDAALGLLSEPSQPSPRLALLRELRDQHLRAAHALVDGESTWRRSQALARELRRFSANAWPRLRFRSRPEAGWSQLRVHLWSAFATGLDVPTSARQLHRLATSAPLAMSGISVDAVINPTPP